MCKLNIKVNTFDIMSLFKNNHLNISIYYLINDIYYYQYKIKKQFYLLNNQDKGIYIKNNLFHHFLQIHIQICIIVFIIILILKTFVSQVVTLDEHLAHGLVHGMQTVPLKRYPSQHQVHTVVEVHIQQLQGQLSQLYVDKFMIQASLHAQVGITQLVESTHDKQFVLVEQFTQGLIHQEKALEFRQYPSLHFVQTVPDVHVSQLLEQAKHIYVEVFIPISDLQLQEGVDQFVVSTQLVQLHGFQHAWQLSSYNNQICKRNKLRKDINKDLQQQQDQKYEVQIALPQFKLICEQMKQGLPLVTGWVIPEKFLFKINKEQSE